MSLNGVTVMKIQGNGNGSRSARLLAKTFFKEMLENGFSREQVVEFSSELIGCISDSICAEKKEHLGLE